MRVNKTYTIFVKTLRVLLPALVLISVIVLVIWPILNQEDALEEVAPIAGEEKPVGVSDDALQMTQPKFTGIDTKNRPYIITAETVYQGSNKEADMTLINPVADLEISSTRWVSLRADNGIYSPSGESLILSGAVTLSDNTGYHIETSQVDVDLKAGRVHSKTRVIGNSPIGTIDAKGMVITLDQSPFITFVGPGKFVLYPENIKK